MNPLQRARDEPEALLHERLAPMLLRLQARMVSHSRFDAATAALVAGLAHEGGFDRVSLGLRERGNSQIVARSDRVAAGEDKGQTSQIAAAMDEALDQSAAVSFPAVAETGSAASLAHRVLAGRGGASCTIPLVAAGRTVGAVTFERNTAFSSGDLELLEHTVSLLAPVIYLSWRDRMPLRARVREWVTQARERMTAPEKRFARIGAAAAATLLLACVLVPVDRQIAGRARVEGVVQRVLVAPTEGFIHSVFVAPGDRVLAGQPLFQLADQDMQLERRKWESQLAQFQSGYTGALARGDRALVGSQLARASEAQAQLELVDARLARARVEAPFDGLVIQGDLRSSIGAPVKQGDVLMTVARTEDFRVVAEIDERDIQPLAVGQRGSIALSALPWSALPIEVTRITPVSSPVEGSNIFEVEGKLLARSPDLRPGLRGVAKITAGKQPLLVGWTRRVVDWARLWLWTLVG